MGGEFSQKGVLSLMCGFYFFTREIIERPDWGLHLQATWVQSKNTKQFILRHSEAL